MNDQAQRSPQLLIVSGGVACGKSTFTASWAQKNPDSRVFCADQAVHELYKEAPVGDQVAALAGKEVLFDDGSVNRAALRERVFDDPSLRETLEALIHPLVREKFRLMFQAASRDGVRWVLADIPLYFEGGGKFISQTDFSSGPVSTVVVACSEAKQIERLLNRNGFDKARSESILRSQMPVTEKILKADFVIWNEGAEQVMHRQTELLSRTLEVLRK